MLSSAVMERSGHSFSLTHNLVPTIGQNQDSKKTNPQFPIRISSYGNLGTLLRLEYNSSPDSPLQVVSICSLRQVSH